MHVSITPQYPLFLVLWMYKFLGYSWIWYVGQTQSDIPRWQRWSWQSWLSRHVTPILFTKTATWHTAGSHLEPGELAVLSQVLRVVLAVVHRRPLHLSLLRDPRRPRGAGSERGLHLSGALVRPAGRLGLSGAVCSPRWAVGGNRAVTRTCALHRWDMGRPAICSCSACCRT